MKSATAKSNAAPSTQGTNLSRRGAATLEFAMALPFLFLLLIGMTWLGYSMLAQAEVHVEARHQAWQKRFDNPEAKAFVFSSNPLYRSDDDYASAKSSKEVKVSPVYDSEPPESEETVLTGSWDHRDLQLDELPNWKQYGTAVINAKTGDVQNLIGSLSNFRNIITDIGADFLKNQIGLNDILNNGYTKSNSGQKQKQNEQLEKEEAERERLTIRQKELEREIEPLRPRARQNVLSPTEKRKYFRLTKELEDVKDDLKELGK